MALFFLALVKLLIMKNRASFPSVFLLFIYTLLLTIMPLAQISAQNPDDEPQSAPNIAETKVKALWIFNFIKVTTWPEANKTELTIGVLGSKEIFQEVVAMAKAEKVNGMTVKPVYFKSLRLVVKTDVLFLDNSQNGRIAELQKAIAGNHTLLITDQLDNYKRIMVNLLPFEKGGRNRFEVNQQNLEKEGIKVPEQMMYYGGNKEVIQGMYTESEKKLKAERELLEQKKQELLKRVAELDKQKSENQKLKLDIEQQQKDIAKQKQLIKDQEGKITDQKAELNKLMVNLTLQMAKLNQNSNVLVGQESNIKRQRQEMISLNKSIEIQRKDIATQNKKLELQKAKLNTYSSKIETQRGIIYVIAFVLLLVFALVFVILVGYKEKQKANKALESKNEAINKQNQVILNQAKRVEAMNKELEKLSIVAAKTENAVMIMDSVGKIDWVNQGFERLYGTNIKNLSTEKAVSLADWSTNPQIEQIIDKCIHEKVTVVYESMLESGDSKYWVQTSLTPIITKSGKIDKLVAIDTDITRVKQAEFEIRMQSEEIWAQKEELERQNEKIELNNKNIKSSINYARTIQQAILPSMTELTKYFDPFVIYLPKDIVSGDFYWMSTVNEEHLNRIFVAAVDCTGHGVPGAFMSMIGNRLLNEIVNEKRIQSPDAILHHLNDAVKIALKQQQSENNDGMDICLCMIESNGETDRKVTYSGAKRPLLCYSKEEKKLTSYSAIRKSIGGVRSVRNKMEFSNTEINLKKGDLIYLSTDGFIDQNLPNRTRIGTPRLEEMIRTVAERDVKEQKQFILSQFETLKSGQEQRDDITILGLELL